MDRLNSRLLGGFVRKGWMENSPGACVNMCSKYVTILTFGSVRRSWCHNVYLSNYLLYSAVKVFQSLLGLSQGSLKFYISLSGIVVVQDYYL